MGCEPSVNGSHDLRRLVRRSRGFRRRLGDAEFDRESFKRIDGIHQGLPPGRYGPYLLQIA